MCVCPYFVFKCVYVQLMLYLLLYMIITVSCHSGIMFINHYLVFYNNNNNNKNNNGLSQNLRRVAHPSFLKGLVRALYNNIYNNIVYNNILTLFTNLRSDTCYHMQYL